MIGKVEGPSADQEIQVALEIASRTNCLQYFENGSNVEIEVARISMEHGGASNFGRGRAVMMAPWNETTELKNSELHIQASEISVFGDWEARGRRSGNEVITPFPQTLSHIE